MPADKGKRCSVTDLWTIPLRGLFKPQMLFLYDALSAKGLIYLFTELQAWQRKARYVYSGVYIAIYKQLELLSLSQEWSHTYYRVLLN